MKARQEPVEQCYTAQLCNEVSITIYIWHIYTVDLAHVQDSTPCVSGLLFTPSILISRNLVPAPLQGLLLVLTLSSVSRLDCDNETPWLEKLHRDVEPLSMSHRSTPNSI